LKTSVYMISESYERGLQYFVMGSKGSLKNRSGLCISACLQCSSRDPFIKSVSSSA